MLFKGGLRACHDVSVNASRSERSGLRSRTLWRRVLIGAAAAAAALAVVGFTLLASYHHGTSGPGDDAELAARSLHRVLIAKEHPGQRLVSVRCDGLRDGSDFFGCRVSRPGLATASYSVSYSGKSHLYAAEGGAPPETLKFKPAKK